MFGQNIAVKPTSGQIAKSNSTLSHASKTSGKNGHVLRGINKKIEASVATTRVNRTGRTAAS